MKNLATGGTEGSIKLWDTKGNNLAILRGHKGEAWTVAFSPDSNLLATSGEDGTVMWDMKGNRLLGLGYIGSSQTFSPNGKLLATNAVQLWQVGGIDELLARTCDWARDYLKYNANLSEEDRRLCDGVGNGK